MKKCLHCGSTYKKEFPKCLSCGGEKSVDYDPKTKMGAVTKPMGNTSRNRVTKRKRR